MRKGASRTAHAVSSRRDMADTDDASCASSPSSATPHSPLNGPGASFLNAKLLTLMEGIQMSCRRTSFARSIRMMLVPTLALVLVAATATFVGAQSSPPPDASYNIVWEASPSFNGQSGAYVGVNGAQGLKGYFPNTGLRLVSGTAPNTWEVNLALTR